MKALNPNTGNLESVYVKALDSMPVGAEISFDGQVSDIPVGWEQVEDIDITSLTGGATINTTYWKNKLVKQGNICHLELAFTPNSTDLITIYQLPSGYYSSGNTATIGLVMRDNVIGKAIITNSGAVQVQVPSASGNTWSFNATWSL